MDPYSRADVEAAWEHAQANLPDGATISWQQRVERSETSAYFGDPPAPRLTEHAEYNH